MAFQDHFSGHASEYARSRPLYPSALFAHLAGLVPDRAMAWDCGTGNGQAAIGLAQRFSAVVATDPSATQLGEAISHPRILYRHGDEGTSGLPDNSADIVTAAQAAHWFDLEKFFAEVTRVLRPTGIVAIWCYGLCQVTPRIGILLRQFYVDTLGPYWPPERRHVDAEYRSLTFPYPEQPFPVLAMEQQWTLAQLIDYVRTWSAVSRFRQVHGDDPVESLTRNLAPEWGPMDKSLRVRWPLRGRLGRMSPS